MPASMHSQSLGITLDLNSCRFSYLQSLGTLWLANTMCVKSVLKFIYECEIKFNGSHALSGEYIGFSAFAEGVRAKLNEAWPGFNLDIEKVVSNETDVWI